LFFLCFSNFFPLHLCFLAKNIKKPNRPKEQSNFIYIVPRVKSVKLTGLAFVEFVFVWTIQVWSKSVQNIREKDAGSNTKKIEIGNKN
jgi:hypothetical protein